MRYAEVATADHRVRGVEHGRDAVARSALAQGLDWRAITRTLKPRQRARQPSERERR